VVARKVTDDDIVDAVATLRDDPGVVRFEQLAVYLGMASQSVQQRVGKLVEVGRLRVNHGVAGSLRLPAEPASDKGHTVVATLVTREDGTNYLRWRD
jgi:hypothetical protein